MISRQRMTYLLKRAAMNIHQWYSKVLYSTDGSNRRVLVGEPIESKWADCVSIYTLHEPHVWKEQIILSPARARILAEHLIQRAEMIEKREGAKFIDKEY